MKARLKRIAFVTCEESPQIIEDDASVGFALPGEVTVEPLVWGGIAESWARFDLLVLRSCWDYHLRHSEFLEWLQRVEESGVPVLNPPRLVAWNSDKRYLRELSARGCQVVPTEWLDGADLLSEGAERIRFLLESHGWRRAVLKPVVGASGLHTWVTDADAIASQADQLRRAAAHGDLMLQPFIPEIETEGEWSLVFFGGELSHCVLKSAKPGDFRVQSDFGGRSVLAAPPARLVEDGQRVLRALPEQPAYARIDGVDRGGRLLLVEAELIEPELFLRSSTGAPSRFADVLSSTLAAV